MDMLRRHKVSFSLRGEHDEAVHSVCDGGVGDNSLAPVGSEMQPYLDCSIFDEIRDRDSFQENVDFNTLNWSDLFREMDSVM